MCTRKPEVRPDRYRSGTAVCDRRGIGYLTWLPLFSPRVGNLITMHSGWQPLFEKHSYPKVWPLPILKTCIFSQRIQQCSLYRLSYTYTKTSPTLCAILRHSPSYKDAGI